MSTKLETATSLGIECTAGDQSSFSFNATGDFVLVNPARNSGGRALVPEGGKVLIINYGNDFSGGVIIENLNLPHIFKGLASAPSGINTFDIVMDKDGNVYKKD